MKKGYPKYRELPFPWPNQIPAGWELAKVSSAFTERKETVSDKDYEPLSVTKEGIVPQLDTAAKTDNGDNRKKVLAGDFVINSRSDRKGSSGLSKYDGSVSVINTVLKPLQDKAEGKYIEYLLKNYFFQEEFYRYGKGIVDDLWSTKYSNMKGIPIPLPPLPEQRQIAAFLDHKCTLIDTFIQKKTRLIELLKEQKQAIINKAVTKGIDPNVRLKPSGIDWLGDIPEGWEVKKLKYVLNEVSIRSEDGVGTLLMVSQEHGIVERAKFHEKSEVAQTTVGHKKCRKNDLVFNKLKAHLGVFFKTNYDGLVSPDYAVYRAKDGMDVLFFEFLFRHPAYIYQFISKITGIVEGLMRLYTSDLFSIKVALPSKNEMADILAFIDGESNKIFKTISRIEREINLLHEYKTTLIAEAVTGKIDVRDWKPKQRSLPIENSTVATP